MCTSPAKPVSAKHGLSQTRRRITAKKKEKKKEKKERRGRKAYKTQMHEVHLKTRKEVIKQASLFRRESERERQRTPFLRLCQTQYSWLLACYIFFVSSQWAPTLLSVELRAIVVRHLLKQSTVMQIDS